MEGLDACDGRMAHSGSRRMHSTSARRCGTPQGRVWHEHAPLRPALPMGTRRRRFLHLRMLRRTSLARPTAPRSQTPASKAAISSRRRVPVFAATCTGREPTANGRAAQATTRALRLSTTPQISAFLHRVLLAFTAEHEATRCSRCATSLACVDFGVQGSNVRHERWTKGREAAFGTSARWRG